MHYDYIHTHTVLCQIYGRKQFTLFAPEDTPYLYATANQSAVKNPDDVDLERFPLFLSGDAATSLRAGTGRSRLFAEWLVALD